MKIIKNLYIVESPLQVLNAFEAMHVFPANEHTLLVRYSDYSENDKQIKDTLKKLNLYTLASIKTITINGEKKSVFDIIKLLFFRVFFNFKSKQFTKIFLGNYGSKFMQFITPFRSSIILLDDGAGSINVQSEFTPTKFHDWFTLFDLDPFPSQIITPNTYRELHKILPNKFNQNKETVLFIGSKISETGITAEENYLHLIKKIALRFSDKKIIYVAHRGESDLKLQQLEKISNLKVTLLDYPIELLSIYGDITPSKIVSFYSTALITLSKIYDVETIAFKFDYSLSEHRDAIDRVYDYYAKYISVIEEKNI